MKNRQAENWAIMLTPFNKDKSIDWPALDELIEWYLAEGVHGLFTLCLSSEMYNFNDEERIALATYVVKRANSRVPVIASGTFGDGKYDMSKYAMFIKRMYDTGVKNVIVLANQLGPELSNEIEIQANIETLLAETDCIPLGLYECPVPYHRLISPKLISWAGQTGRFHWMKETSETLEIVNQKNQGTRDTPLAVHNAHTASLLESLKAGAAGFAGIANNFYPALLSWMTENFAAHPETAIELNKYLVKSQAVVDHKYHTSAKQFLALRGLKLGLTSRVAENPHDPVEILAQQNMLVEMKAWYRRLSIAPAF